MNSFKELRDSIEEVITKLMDEANKDDAGDDDVDDYDDDSDDADEKLKKTIKRSLTKTDNGLKDKVNVEIDKEDFLGPLGVRTAGIECPSVSHYSKFKIHGLLM